MMTSNPLFSTLTLAPPDCILFSVNPTEVNPGNSSFILPTYEVIARRTSGVLDTLMATREFQEQRILQLNLRSVNSDTCLRKALEYTVTGEVDLFGCTIEQMASLADELEMIQIKKHLSGIIQPAPVFPNLTATLPFQNIQTAYWCNLVSAFLQGYPSAFVTDDKVVKKKARDRKISNSADVDEPFDNMGDLIIPSTDNEGWCRNKKYIEKTENGFMCTVCRKTYGRYNSVSYHVTIYHRNPPIKCDMPGCQFTTREARYIHFHKYYRHSIPLPTTIDQGTRKCQFCRHVAKSPAMLEKHIKRHQNIEGLVKVDEHSQQNLTVIDDCMRSRTGSQSITPDEPMDLEITKPRAKTM